MAAPIVATYERLSTLQNEKITTRTQPSPYQTPNIWLAKVTPHCYMLIQARSTNQASAEDVDCGPLTHVEEYSHFATPHQQEY